MKRRFRRTIGVTVAAALVLTSTMPVNARSLTRPEYEACQAQDDTAFRGAVEALTRAALQNALSRVDYTAAVRDEWRRGGLNDIVDKQVDKAITDVQTSTSWSDRLYSLGSKDKAQDLAKDVAERTYRSDAMTAALEQLATGVGRDIGRSIELGAIDAAEPAQECLRAFLGPRYGSTIASVITQDAAREFSADAFKTGSANPQIAPSSGVVAGSVVLILRQSLARLASRVGQRVVGAVLTRLVSVVAGGVGLALIAKDVWDYGGMLWQGILPVVASEMKSADTKDKVQQELAKSIAEQMGEHIQEISRATSGRVVDLWQEFRRGHAKVLDLAEKNPGFRTFVDTLKPDDLPRLDEVVALVLASEGEAGVLTRVSNGTLLRAVTKLPPAALDIARDTNSLATALAWSDIAGNDLRPVIAFDLHKRAKPQDFSAATLKRVLALDERLAVQRIASLPREARDTLLELPDADVKALARGLPESDLASLSRYLTSLDRPIAQRLLGAVVKQPGRMQALSPDRVRTAVLTSQDQGAALDMVLRPPGFDVQALQRDVRLAMDGKVSPILLWDAHPYAGIGGGVAALALLLMLRRLFSRRSTPKAA